jgi:hypothetical protein
VWKTGKLLANVHQALADKWEVRMHPMGDMVELVVSTSGESVPLTLNLNVVEGKAIWGYIDLPVTAAQEELLQQVTEQLTKAAGAAIGPLKQHIKFKYEGETVETETTTADVYSWTLNYGLRYSLPDVIRFLASLDSLIRQRGGRPLEGNEFFVTYKDGALHLRDEALSFVLISPWGYYSAFLHVGEETLELQICDEEETEFPADKFDALVKDTVALFDSDKEVTLQETE